MNKFKKLSPLYDKLNFGDKIFLKTCAYYPWSPRAHRGNHNRPPLETRLEHDLKHIKNVYHDSLFSSKHSLRILDFGCGAGLHALALAKAFPHYSVYGIDINKINQVAEEYAKTNRINNLTYIHGMSFDLDSNSFDVVLSHDSFEHFEDPDAILKEIYRLLKPGGKLYLKFGPLWKSPYGRHLSGMIRKDRPWVHLLVTEKRLMRIYSYLAGMDHFLTKYTQIPGGMNQMTIKKFLGCVIKSDLKLLHYKRSRAFPYTDKLMHFKITQEYFSGSISAVLEKE